MIIKMEKSNDDMDIIQEDSMNIEENTESTCKVYDEKIYNQIVCFVQSLQENYGQYFYEIKLYNLLLENTGIVHQVQRKKHVEIFQSFLQENKIAILEQNKNKLNENYIKYSDKIYININSIFEKASEDDRDTIWEHLLVLLALTVPDSKAENVLTLKKPMNSSVSNPVSEDNPFKNMFENLTKQLENTNLNESNPMEIVGNIMNSGIMNDLFKSLPIPSNDANQPFDMNDMMRTVQDIMVKMQENPQQPPSSK